MTISKIKNPSLYAASFALAVILALGAGHRMLGAKLGISAAQVSPVDSNLLSLVPHAIGDWRGEDIPMEDRIVKIARIDCYLNRSYSKGTAGSEVSLYIGCGHDPSLVTHSPDRCYLGGGWIPRSKTKSELSAGDITVPLNVYEYTREGWNERGITLFQMFVVDGEYYTETSAAQHRSMGRLQTVHYFAQVQLVTQSSLLTGESEQGLLTEFSREAFPHVSEMFAALLEERRAILGAESQVNQ